jgi:hypothetical protein
VATATKEAKNNIAPCIVMVPLEVRQLVDSIAAARGVSRSEIGRRALQEYVKQALGEEGQPG